MKKILFLMRYPYKDFHHLKPKFDGQMKSCVSLGYDVYCLVYDVDNYYLLSFNNQTLQKIGKVHFGSYKKYRNTFAFYDMYNALSVVSESYQFDYIYMRSKQIWYRGLNAIATLKKNGARLIVELPAFHSTEKSLSFFRVIISKLLNRSRKKLAPLIDLYTLIGPDCDGKYNNRPAINIMNGVNVAQMPLRKYSPQEEYHFLALASMRVWHAYDRMIKGLANYAGKEKIVIDMVGGDNDGSLREWKELAVHLGVNDKIVYHGPMYGKDLDEMFDIADIGIATLGLHRNKMPSGSVLKLGEYCARGLPFVYGYHDRNFAGTEEFLFKVSEDDAPLPIDEIMEWAVQMRNDMSIGSRMRQYAIDNMSWEKEFKKILKKVEELAEGEKNND